MFPSFRGEPASLTCRRLYGGEMSPSSTSRERQLSNGGAVPPVIVFVVQSLSDTCHAPPVKNAGRQRECPTATDPLRSAVHFSRPSRTIACNPRRPLHVHFQEAKYRALPPKSTPHHQFVARQQSRS